VLTISTSMVRMFCWVQASADLGVKTSEEDASQLAITGVYTNYNPESP
jgi:hypothetical protein